MAMERYHEGRTRAEPGMSAKRAWLPPTAGIRDWRRELAPHDIEKFEAIAGDLLDALAYERGCGRPSEAAMRHAAHMRERFCRRSDSEPERAIRPSGRCR